jgi:uncharacterized linocin/CFP29 family protein
MNNLHRELAPISGAAWAQIDAEAARTLKQYLSARRVVDVPPPKGPDAAAVATGHVQTIEAPLEGLQAVQHAVRALVELRVPFLLSRQAIDDVERGALDCDWEAVKDAARKLALAEDRAVFDGYAAAGIQGIRQGASNPITTLPAAVTGYPGAVAQAVNRLRLAGVDGPYALVLGTDPYTAISAGTEAGYPVQPHIEHIVEGGIVWSPAIQGGLVLSTRGGDFELTIGQDISIGYVGHSQSAVELYLKESFTFRVLTTEAAVALTVPKSKGSSADR